MSVIGWVSALAMLALGGGSAAEPKPDAGDVPELLKGAQRVLFLGDSITHAAEYTVDVEFYLTLRYPRARTRFFNAGLPSETVSGLSEDGHAGGAFPRPNLHDRLTRLLAHVRPDLVIACYGMNDGLLLPFDEARFRAFVDGMQRLHEQVVQSGATIVHVTPPVFDDERGGRRYDDVLARYSAWLLAQRDAAEWTVIDVHGPMARALSERRRTEPSFYFAEDAIHPGTVGHWLIAQQILAGLGADEVQRLPDRAALVGSHPRGAEIFRLIHERHVLLRDALLQTVGHRRPGLPVGLPWAEAERGAEAMERDVRGLIEGP